MSQPMTIVSPPTTINVSALKASCSACSMHQLCLPMGLGEADIHKLDQIIGHQLGITLYRIPARQIGPDSGTHAVRPVTGADQRDRFGRKEMIQVTQTHWMIVTVFMKYDELIN